MRKLFLKNEKIVEAISELPAKEHSQSSPTSILSAYFLYYLIKNPKTTIALKFLTHNISGIGGVWDETVPFLLLLT